MALEISGTKAAIGAVVCALAGLALLVPVLRERGRSGRRRAGLRGSGGGSGGARSEPRQGARWGVRGGGRTLWAGAAACLLCAAAAGGSAALHAADLHRGPLPRLAGTGAEVTVEVTLTKDPRATRPQVRGARQSAGVVVAKAEAVTLLAEDGSRTELRTPVLLMVRPEHDEEAREDEAEQAAKDAEQANKGEETGESAQGEVAGPASSAGGTRAAWLRLLPSTRLTVRAEVVRPAADRRGGQDVAVVLRTGPGPPKVKAGPTQLQRAAGQLREGLRDATDGLGVDARGLLPGLVVGDTSRLSPQLDEAFHATDMTHLLAVSGASLSILLVLFIGPPGIAHRAERRGLAPRLGLPLRTTAVVAGLLTLGFVVVCRPEPSVLRAAACGLIAVWAIGTGRRRSLLPALAAAVLVLLFYDPWLARQFGFLLSVLATASLLTIAPRWAAALRRRGCPARLAEALAAAAAAQVACAPVVTVTAAHVSLVAVPCNLLAEFAVAPATVLGFAALVTAPMAMPVAEGLAWLASWPVEAIAGIARTGAGLPGAEIAWSGSWTGALVLAAVLGGLALVAVRLRVPYRPWLCAACGLVLLVAVLRPAPLVRPFTGWPPTGWRMVACDVGQGDALVLAVDGERGGGGGAVVVDAGPEPRAVDRCLRELGVTSVPLVVLTHFHADHVAGLPGLLRGRKIGAIQTTGLAEPPGQAEFVRRTARQAGVPVLPAHAGERRHTGDLRWEVVWPPSPTPSPPSPPYPPPPPSPAAGDGGPSGGSGNAAVGTAHTDAARTGTPHLSTARPGTARPGTARPGTAGTATAGTERAAGTGRAGMAPAAGRSGTDGGGTDGSRTEEGGGGANDASVTLLVRTAGLRVFLPGDLEPAAQRALLALRPDLPQAEVLKVAHHGSRFQDPVLLSRLRPRVALVSAGRENPYGHPAPETLRALTATGALVARTDRHGSLALVRRPDGTPAVVTRRGSPGTGTGAGAETDPGTETGSEEETAPGRETGPGTWTAPGAGRGEGPASHVVGGRLSRAPASRRARRRGSPARRGRVRHAGLRGPRATGRPRRRPRPPGPRGPVRVPRRAPGAVPAARPPPRRRPCRAAPAHVVHRSPGHCPSAAAALPRLVPGSSGVRCRCGVGCWAGWLVRVRRPRTIRSPP
ncbi:ComEC/Rec2 family competence protein [Streptomyces albus subsp. chlorinus]|nr:ComEC/Rec2 family competence protein [Streptomyces albus]